MDFPPPCLTVPHLLGELASYPVFFVFPPPRKLLFSTPFTFFCRGQFACFFPKTSTSLHFLSPQGSDSALLVGSSGHLVPIAPILVPLPCGIKVSLSRIFFFLPSNAFKPLYHFFSHVPFALMAPLDRTLVFFLLVFFRTVSWMDSLV